MKVEGQTYLQRRVPFVKHLLNARRLLLWHPRRVVLSNQPAAIVLTVQEGEACLWQYNGSTGQYKVVTGSTRAAQRMTDEW